MTFMVSNSLLSEEFLMIIKIIIYLFYLINQLLWIIKEV